MGVFSIREALADSVRLIRREPWAVAIWMGLHLVHSLLLVMGALALGIGPHDVAVRPPHSHAPLQSPSRLFGSLVERPALTLLLLPITVWLAAAVYRAFLHPDARKRAYLRLGSAEWRLLGLHIYMGAALILGMAILVLPMTIVLLLLMMVAGASSAFSVGVMVAIVPAVLIPVATRLSLAEVTTFDGSRIALFRTWRATRRLFWPLLGAFVTVGALGVVVGVLPHAVLVLTSDPGVLLDRPLMHPVEIMHLPRTMAELFTPLTLLLQLYGSVVSTLTTVGFIGVAVAAYRSQPRSEPLAE